MTRRTWIPLSVTLGLVLVALLSWGAHAVYVREIRGVPLIDEWQCSDGEVPVTYPEGGADCLREGAELPAGATLDPLGNRPFSCDQRWGWTVVVKGEDEDCLRDGRPLPEGWRVR
ncbi:MULTISPECIES: hypothetical protein [unclassified Nocardioides]|uniref:hypothetical protein n=1 Tax=unclassified Nocardioides TaxID=2615069 RepID=UPI003014E259